VGEAGILGVASAIANALEDAVGVRITSLPLSPDKVLAALEAMTKEHAT
jgi:CO/xanthine dehydrogenase Mo-binding subunit